MANGDDQQSYDINDWLRKKAMINDMPNVTGQQPSNIAGSTTYQPPPDFSQVAGSSTYQPSNLQQIQSDIDRMRSLQDQAPDPSKVQAAATDLTSIGPERPMQSFKMNKPLAIALGIVGAKNWIRNPMGEYQAINEIARKGWAGYHQQYQQDLAQKERVFKTDAEVYNQQASMHATNIANAGNIAAKQMELEKFKQESAMWPLQYQRAANDLIVSTDAANRVGKPVLTNEPVVVHTKDGDFMGLRRSYPAGSKIPYDFALANGKIIEPGEGVSFTPYEKVGTSPYESILTDLNAQFAKDNGRPPQPGKESEDLKMKALDEASKPAVDRQTRAIAEQEKLKQKTIEASNAKDVADKYDAFAKRITDPITTELGSIRGLKASLMAAMQPGNENQVASQLAIVEAATSMAGGFRPVSRYNQAEIQAILGATGGINELRAKIARWTQDKSGVPSETITQLNQLANVMQRELLVQQKIVDKFQTRRNKDLLTGNTNDLSGLQEELNKALQMGDPKMNEAMKRGMVVQ